MSTSNKCFLRETTQKLLILGVKTSRIPNNITQVKNEGKETFKKGKKEIMSIYGVMNKPRGIELFPYIGDNDK